jgi:predicted dehydrogenase
MAVAGSHVMTSTHDDTTSTRKVAFVPPLRRELEAFVAYVAGNGPTPKTSFADGVETVRTIERLRVLAGVDRVLPIELRATSANHWDSAPSESDCLRQTSP